MSDEQLTPLLVSVEKELEASMLPTQIFSHDEVFQAEMERIYGRCWMFVAHESEIPTPGDYVLRRIGLDPVIVVRDEDGDVHVLSNYCRHRATLVCRADRGNTSHFRCPYHGWIYKNNGDWLGAPHRRQAYRELDPKQWGLLRAPNVAVHQGLIFASLAPDAPSLADYLGGAAWMLDAILGLHPDGMRVMGPPDRWRIKTDWKSGAENFAGDSYHPDTAHISGQDVGLIQGLKELAKFACHYDLGDGHGFIGHGMAEWLGPEWAYWGYPQELVDKFDLSKFDEAQKHMIGSGRPPVIGTVFPNLSYVRFASSPNPGVEPTVTFTSIRQWQPIAPGVVELWSWQLTFNCVSEEYSRACYDAGQYTFSSSGVFEQDDTLVWEGLPKAARSVFVQKNQMSLNYQMGHGSMSDHTVDPNWQGPGVMRLSGYGEQNQMAFYRRWLKEMRQTG